MLIALFFDPSQTRFHKGNSHLKNTSNYDIYNTNYDFYNTKKPFYYDIYNTKPIAYDTKHLYVIINHYICITNY